MIPPAISGKTRVVAILGDPVSHTRSPAMHNAAFAALGLDYVYVALRVEPRDLRRAMTGIRALGIWGLNVTVPHKERILPLLDRLTPRAREIGAVNTVFRQGDELVGDNTDADGFRLALHDIGVRARGKRIVVLGAGGSARAVVCTLVRGGARSLTLLNRTQRRAESLAELARKLGGSEVRTGLLEEATIPDTLAGVGLVVHCTSLGLDGRSRPPLALSALPEKAAVYDLVYGAEPTPLMREARSEGHLAADGRGMLLHQAALAFRRWTRRRPPLETMVEALNGASAGPGYVMLSSTISRPGRR